jgi:hypothetical protein
MRHSASFYSRLGLLVGASVALPGLFACLDHPLKPVEYEAQQEKQDSIALTVNKDVDILFVIDNSGSMAEEQATLAANFSSFIEVLERPEVSANYRIGITTTDNGNPWCEGTTPEGGKLVLTSCRSRTQDFVFMGANPVDATQEACLDVCPEEFTNIQIQPSASDGDEEMKARPWIESIEGATNLPEGLSTVQAFQCLGPQGINGCGFEEHLESMYKSLKRATTEGEDQYGFLRANAILSVVHLTDEVDCSFNKDHETIFLPDGNRIFWSDPDASAPSSAVCWNAGVECTGGPGTYEECHSVNYDVDKNIVDEADAEAQAVLRPMSRYIDFLQAFETAKQDITPDQEVLVALIAGVGGDGSVTYADTQADPTFQSDFGIGAGCQSAAGTAVPPVRLKEFAEAFEVNDAQNMFSICNDSYSAALEAIATAIADQVRPACMPACVADTDPTSEELEPQCTLIQEAPQDDGTLETSTIPACEGGDHPNDDNNVCYIALTDGAITATGDREFISEDDTSDDMNEVCAEEGWNLEFILLRREGFPAPGGTSVKATCQLSSQKAIDCPQLN